jgi:hypothetical protein
VNNADNGILSQPRFLFTSSVRTELPDDVPGTRLARDQRPEKLLRLELVVRAAAQGQISGARFTACRERNNVVEFQEAALGAPPSSPDERALAGIAGPHDSLHGGGDVPRLRCE